MPPLLTCHQPIQLRGTRAGSSVCHRVAIWTDSLPAWHALFTREMGGYEPGLLEERGILRGGGGQARLRCHRDPLDDLDLLARTKDAVPVKT